MNQPLINTNGCLARLTNVNIFFNYHGVTFNAETVFAVDNISNQEHIELISLNKCIVLNAYNYSFKVYIVVVFSISGKFYFFTFLGMIFFS